MDDMHRSEEPDHQVCVICGRDVVAGTDRAYVVSDEEVVCNECAVRLGGAWDEITNTWSKPPDPEGAPIHRDHAHT